MVLLGTGLVLYDFQLGASFRQGEYTEPFFNYDQLHFTGFDRIELNSSTAITVMLVRGDFKVFATPGVREFLRVRQEGTKLIIDARFRYHYRNVFGDYLLYISCPDLKAFKADARYTVGDMIITDSANRDFWFMPSVISGFRLDSLTVDEEDAANLVLKKDTIKAFRGNVGKGAALSIGTENSFDVAELHVTNEGRLRVNTPDVRNLNIHLADSATLITTGAAAKQLLKISQP